MIWSCSQLRGLILVVAVALLAGACSSTEDSGAPDSGGESTATTEIELGNPGTLVAPTSTTAVGRYSLSIETAVAFLDSCAADSSLVGGCHCALGRLDQNLDDNGLRVFEDRFAGRNEFGPEVAAALADCEGAPRPAGWSAESIDLFVTECIKGSERLRDICTCSTARAQDIIPQARISEYAESNQVVPGFVQLINLCI